MAGSSGRSVPVKVMKMLGVAFPIGLVLTATFIAFVVALLWLLLWLFGGFLSLGGLE